MLNKCTIEMANRCVKIKVNVLPPILGRPGRLRVGRITTFSTLKSNNQPESFILDLLLASIPEVNLIISA